MMTDPNITDDKTMEIDRLLISSLLFIKITNRKNVFLLVHFLGAKNVEAEILEGFSFFIE
ncbi:hypothetical protein [Parageobacillus genomosp. 1]|uniref:hypothetical protein n=1 Tax=Parageobacillus genomosp. 1 TaxID=1295642 RepID=UPI00163FA283|nr:hypothetical protein [Parageobacillus genomosp. 1]